MDAVGGYQLLGRGSESRPSSVRKARHPASARSVALKSVELTSSDAIGRVRAQTRIMNGISHPGIVEILDLVEVDRQAWLVEDWVDGASVAAVLEAGGEFSAVEAVAIGSDALAALAHVHERAIVHGNLTTDCLLLDVEGRLRLTDFGAQDGPVGGWPISPQSDVRAVGAIVQALLPSAPLRIDAVLQTSVAVRPDRRYQNALDLQRALGEAAEAEFGPGWREQVDLSRCLTVVADRRAARSDGAVLEPAPVLLLSSSGSADEAIGSRSDSDALAGPAVHPSEHRVKVRSPKRAARPVEHVAEVRDYLEPRSPRAPGGDGNAGRFIPILATVVVVVAIVVLVVTHHDMNKSTPAGLAFRGTYDVTTTFGSVGVGVDQDQSIGSVKPEKWRVSSTCSQAKTCAASVTPSSGAAFTLNLDGEVWTGEQSMPKSNSCVGVYSYTLKSTPSGDDALVGTVVGTVAGCDRSGTETASLSAKRMPG